MPSIINKIYQTFGNILIIPQRFILWLWNTVLYILHLPVRFVKWIVKWLVTIIKFLFKLFCYSAIACFVLFVFFVILGYIKGNKTPKIDDVVNKKTILNETKAGVYDFLEDNLNIGRPLSSYSIPELIELHKENPDSAIVSEFIDSLIINHTSYHNLKSLLVYTESLSFDDGRFNILLDSISDRVVKGSTYDIIEAYKSGLDNTYYEELVEDVIMRHLVDYSWRECRSYSSGLKDTPYEERIKSYLYNDIKFELDYERDDYISSLENSLVGVEKENWKYLYIKSQTAIDKSVGGMVNKIFNNMLSKAEYTDKCFLTAWNQNIDVKSLNQKLYNMSFHSFSSYSKKRNKILKELNVASKLSPLTFSYNYRPNMTIFRKYASEEFRSSWSDTAIETAMLPCAWYVDVAYLCYDIVTSPETTSEEKLAAAQTEYCILKSMNEVHEKISRTSKDIEERDKITINTFLKN